MAQVTEAGRVKFYNPREGDGTGVVELDSGEADVAIDGAVVLASGFWSLAAGQRVSVVLAEGEASTIAQPRRAIRLTLDET
jgi:cold shock CspA family protein